MIRRPALLVALLAALAACTENPTKVPDGGTAIIPPGCNNWDVADTTESCRLPLDTTVFSASFDETCRKWHRFMLVK